MVSFHMWALMQDHTIRGERDGPSPLYSGASIFSKLNFKIWIHLPTDPFSTSLQSISNKLWELRDVCGSRSHLALTCACGRHGELTTHRFPVTFLHPRGDDRFTPVFKAVLPESLIFTRDFTDFCRWWDTERLQNWGTFFLTGCSVLQTAEPLRLCDALFTSDHVTDPLLNSFQTFKHVFLSWARFSFFYRPASIWHGS